MARGGGMDTEVAVRVRRQWNWNRDNIKFGGIRRVDMEVEAMWLRLWQNVYGEVTTIE